MEKTKSATNILITSKKRLLTSSIAPPILTDDFVILENSPDLKNNKNSPLPGNQQKKKSFFGKLLNRK